jgi:Flp pilus assembly protein TadG
MSGERESGQLSAFVVVLALPFIAVAGLVYDGGQVLAAHEQAIQSAFEAARAGAQALDQGVLRSSGEVTLDTRQARADALSYLAAVGQSGTVSVSGDAVTVTVSMRHPLAVLSALGLGPVTVSGTATATAVQGVEGGGS